MASATNQLYAGRTTARLRIGPLLSKLTLVFCLGVFADCSFTGKEAQLPSVTRAEHRLAKAERIRSDLPQEMAEILSVARTAAGQIRSPTEATAEPMMRIYNRATADLATKIPELTQLIQNGGSGERITIQNRRTGETYRLQLGAIGRGEYSWTYFQQILDARTWRPRKGEETVVIAGLGGTLVGVHRTVSPGSPPPRLESAYGYRVPVTSIIEFGRPNRTAPVEACLHLIAPRWRNTIEFNGERFPLAADYSAPLLSYSRLNEFWLGFINMIRGENMRNTPGLLLAEPYDPNRIPVIFIHGLLSSKYIWRRTILALLQDPDIRRRYQFWVFSYSTGNPISLSALRLREDLAFAQKSLGMQHNVVLMGHSMGGLLARMQVTNSRRTIWNAVFGPRAKELYQKFRTILKSSML